MSIRGFATIVRRSLTLAVLSAKPFASFAAFAFRPLPPPWRCVIIE
jgi:hypothetical protein